MILNIRQILAQLKEQGISTYEFPQEEAKTEESWMRGLVPFAVVGSNTIIQVCTSNFEKTKIFTNPRTPMGRRCEVVATPGGASTSRRDNTATSRHSGP